MNTRTLRTAPAIALAAAGLLLGGAAGAAVAAPQQDTASASATALQERPSGKYGPYSSYKSCYKAGERGKDHGRWHHFVCKYQHHKWWLYTYR
ncbi:hypothetical protein [Streptomyces albireticuli]|uniref:hypothetical protein n=1 Tax=Streptomyces albireticuli TaxID=1940 RepID=UPI0036B0215A